VLNVLHAYVFPKEFAIRTASGCRLPPAQTGGMNQVPHRMEQPGLHDLLSHVAEALLMAAGMFWQVGWSLVLGFIISAALQALVSQARVTAALGGSGLREVALATAAGAASSSCSYAAAAVTATLFRKGAGLVPSLAFLLASTNLVAELGIVLLLLLGWQFMAGEWIGGIVLIMIMALIVRLTYPAALVEAARRHAGAASGHDHAGMSEAPGTTWQKLRQSETWVHMAQSFAMDVSMLWKDLVAGFLIAGALAAFVPAGVWQALFVKGTSPWLQVPANALLGPLVAVLSFVCSIGNVPLAAVLWGAGVSFGGVLAFLFADLIVLPLLDAYRRSFGLKMAAYIAAVFYLTMVLSGILMDVAFTALGLIPTRRPNLHAEMTSFSLDATFWLNMLALCVAVSLFVVSRRQPVQHAHCAHHGG
jgi:uncharacterized membrane protein YraQ (UPF0718 family)